MCQDQIHDLCPIRSVCARFSTLARFKISRIRFEFFVRFARLWLRLRLPWLRLLWLCWLEIPGIWVSDWVALDLGCWNIGPGYPRPDNLALLLCGCPTNPINLANPTNPTIPTNLTNPNDQLIQPIQPTQQPYSPYGCYVTNSLDTEERSEHRTHNKHI